VILFIYPTICSKVFMTFKCIEVGGAQYLVNDMSKRCFEGAWLWAAVVASAAMAVYVVGIPLLLLVLLFFGRRRGTLSFPAIDIDPDAPIKAAEIANQVNLQNEYLRNRIAFGTLYYQYEPRFWWFEFGCTMRKMILTGALVLFGAGTTPQVVIALAVCIFWLQLVTNLKPFGEDVDDRLAQVEGMQVLFTLLIGHVLQLQAATESSTASEENSLGVVLIILNCIVIALAVVQQPLSRTIASRLARFPSRCATFIQGRRGEWEPAWIVAPSDAD
jgi:hypothetical protein